MKNFQERTVLILLICACLIAFITGFFIVRTGLHQYTKCQQSCQTDTVTVLHAPDGEVVCLCKHSDNSWSVANE